MPAAAAPSGSVPTMVQREVLPGASPGSASSSSESPSTASAAPAAGAAPPQSDHELDELARKLQDRMSRLLRRELLVERERAGMGTDLR